VNKGRNATSWRYKAEAASATFSAGASAAEESGRCGGNGTPPGDIVTGGRGLGRQRIGVRAENGENAGRFRRTVVQCVGRPYDGGRGIRRGLGRRQECRQLLHAFLRNAARRGVIGGRPGSLRAYGTRDFDRGRARNSGAAEI
jgi:hypothetical protein